jgi:hypothetical protein
MGRVEARSQIRPGKCFTHPRNALGVTYARRRRVPGSRPRYAAGSGPSSIRWIRIRSLELESKHMSDSAHVAGVACYKNRSALPARVCQENVKGEAARHSSQLNAFRFAEGRERQPKGVPCRCRRRDHSATPDERAQYVSLKRLPGFHGADARSQLGRDHGTQVQAGR